MRNLLFFALLAGGAAFVWTRRDQIIPPLAAILPGAAAPTTTDIAYPASAGPWAGVDRTDPLSVMV